MQRAAVFHSCHAPFAYPVGDAHFRIVLEAAHGDLRAATCVHGDRYAWPTKADPGKEMEWLGDDGVHEYWGVTIPVPTRRVRYALHLCGKDGSQVWLSERGMQPRRPTEGFFEYAYIHRGDRYQQPSWIRGAIFYEIFPDRFCNGGGAIDPPRPMPWDARPATHTPAGGDFAGIQQKLQYLKDLGVGCI